MIGCGPVGLAVITALGMAAARQRRDEPPRRLAVASHNGGRVGAPHVAAGVALAGVGLRHLGLGWTLGVAACGGRGNALVLSVPAISRLLARDRVIATGRVSSSRIPAFFLALVLGAILASGNVLLAQRFAPELLAFPPIVAWLAGAPIVIGLVLAAALHRPAVAAPAAAARAAARRHARAPAARSAPGRRPARRLPARGHRRVQRRPDRRGRARHP